MNPDPYRNSCDIPEEVRALLIKPAAVQCAMILLVAHSTSSGPEQLAAAHLGSHQQRKREQLCISREKLS